MFVVCPFQDMYTSCHLVVGNINRHGLYIPDIIYGVFGQNGNEAGLAYKFQQGIDLVNFNTDFEIIVT